MEIELSDFELLTSIENMETSLWCSDELTDDILVETVERLEHEQLTYKEVNFNVLQASTLTSDTIDNVLSLPTPAPLHLSPTILTEDDVIEISSDSSSSRDMMEDSESLSSGSSEELTDLLLETVGRIAQEHNMLPQLTYEEVREYFNALPTEDDVIEISSDSSSNLSDVEPD